MAEIARVEDITSDTDGTNGKDCSVDESDDEKENVKSEPSAYHGSGRFSA